MNSINLNPVDGHIEYVFPYSKGLVAAVKKSIPNVSYDPTRKLWRCPSSPAAALFARKFANSYEFSLSPAILRLVDESEVTVTFNEHIEKSIREYQRNAVEFMRLGNGDVILADDCGLGKTLEALAYYDSCIRQGSKTKHVLITCPSVVTDKWESEIQKWLGDNANVQILRTGAMPYKRMEFTILSYAMLLNRYTEFMDTVFDLVIFDECHNMSNPKAGRTNAAKNIRGTHRLMLSGTPFMNRPIELFSILNYLYPTVWKSYWSYAQKYCDAHQTQFGWDVKGASNTDELRSKLATILLRRTKSDVLSELPDITRSYIHVRPSLTEYKSVLRTMQSESDVFANFSKLRLAVGISKISSTVELAESILSENNTKKIVIYAHHHRVCSQLEQKLKKYKPVLITGEADVHTRTSSIAAFQSPKTSSPRVAIISQAGGEGIDLFAASDIIFAERAWNPAREIQAEGRLHRMGQRNPVTSYYLIADGTYDQDMDDIVNAKRQVCNTIYDLDFENDDSPRSDTSLSSILAKMIWERRNE